jgi:molybdenum cofactor cytidylyltransferase
VIAAVVLAAGSASRFGAQKLLLPYRGAPLLRRTVESIAAAQVQPIVVVTSLADALAGLPVRVVENPEAAQGMSTSLRAGLLALPEDIEGAFVCLGDQPGIEEKIFARLMDAFRTTGKPIAAPYYQGVRGNPVLFASALFDELCALKGDQGARSLLAARPSDIAPVQFDFPMPRDIDTPADYEALLRG